MAALVIVVGAGKAKTASRRVVPVAANYLGVSRQHLVDLLESGQVPFHKVGSHRRIQFKDLLAFERLRDRSRREALDRLATQVDKAGLYNADYAAK